MNNISELIKLMTKTTPVGSKVIIGKKVEVYSQHRNGDLREYTVESYSKLDGSMTLSRNVGNKKVILKLPIKIENNFTDSEYNPEDIDNINPGAVFTASGKLVYLIAP